jgi:hypothetical protein
MGCPSMTSRRNIWLGTLLKMVHQMKVDGSDMVFDVFRKQRGGPTRLRPERKKRFDFPDAG